MKNNVQFPAATVAACKPRYIYSELYQMLEESCSQYYFTNQFGVKFTLTRSSLPIRRRRDKKRKAFVASFVIHAEQIGATDGDMHVRVQIPKYFTHSKPAAEWTPQDVWLMKGIERKVWNNSFLFEDHCFGQRVTWNNKQGSRERSIVIYDELSLKQMATYSEHDLFEHQRVADLAFLAAME